MKRIALLLLLCGAVFSSAAQEVVRLDEDLEVREDGRSYLKSTGELFTGKAHGYTSNTSEPMSVDFVNGRRSGWFVAFFDEERTVRKGQVPYVNGLQHGEYRSFFENGETAFTVRMKKGKKTGKRYCYREKNNTLWHLHHYRNDKEVKVRKSWASEGYLEIKEPMRKDKVHGKVEAFHENGQRKRKTVYVRGKRQGKARYWYENGRLRQEGCFVDDRMEGLWVEYHDTKEVKIKERRFYQAGKKTGLSEEYDKEGQIRRVVGNLDNKREGGYESYSGEGILLEYGHFRAGLRHGVWRDYDKQGRLREITGYSRHKKDGIYERYNPETGFLKESGTYKAGEKDGIWREFGPDGGLLRQEEYKEGKKIY